MILCRFCDGWVDSGKAEGSQEENIGERTKQAVVSGSRLRSRSTRGHTRADGCALFLGFGLVAQQPDVERLKTKGLWDGEHRAVWRRVGQKGGYHARLSLVVVVVGGDIVDGMFRQGDVVEIQINLSSTIITVRCAPRCSAPALAKRLLLSFVIRVLSVHFSFFLLLLLVPATSSRKAFFPSAFSAENIGRPRRPGGR